MAMLDVDRQELAALNDVRLLALIEAEGAGVEQAIERLIAEAQPVIDGVLARYARSRTLLPREDAEDVNATIHLRLMLKLRNVSLSPEEAIQSFRGYVATLAYNAVNDHLRKRFPERARLKTRLRYALLQDARMALWGVDAGAACGWSVWTGRQDAVDAVPPHALAAVAAVNRHDAATALGEIFSATRRPVLFDTAVDAVAEGWSIVDREPVRLEDRAHLAAETTRVEDLDFVRALWAEIRELRPMQRKALLLNLRYGSETNLVSLLVLAGVARFGEIAVVLEMTHAELAAIWRALPIEDTKIAERFGITRQQVINLRKAARDRLSRRLGR